jgi:hypothetical protein
MTDLAQNLEKLIKKAALDGALTEDAVAQFDSIVKERNHLSEQLDYSEQHYKTEAEKCNRYHEQLATANKCLEEWAGREQDLLTREHECLEKELRAEYEAKRVEDHKTMFTTVFRNSVLRKEVMTPLEAGEPNQYNSCPSGGYAQKDTVEEEEQ